MSPRLLLLGGTTEAAALAALLAAHDVAAVYSYAGRVANPRVQPLPTRDGGFGGVEGLIAYLRDNSITHLVDATHPFAAQISRNAAQAAAQTGVKFTALRRAPWRPVTGDNWQSVADMGAAVDALAGARRNVMLALGRLNLPAFAAQPQHHYVLRLVDAPQEPLPLPDATVILARGPFDVAGDSVLFEKHAIDVVVCKNAGGAGAEAKLHAARALSLPVIMIDRPDLPESHVCATPQEVLDWLDHPLANLGV